MNTQGSCEVLKACQVSEGQSEAFVGVCLYQKGVFFQKAYYFIFLKVFMFMGVKKKHTHAQENTYCGATILSPHPKDRSTSPEDCIERHPSNTEIRKSEALSTTCRRDVAVFLECALMSNRCSQAFRTHFRNENAGVL